jgi:hypothetical protein
MGVSVTFLGIVIVRLSAILGEAFSDVYPSVRGSFARMQVVAMGFLIIAQALQAFQTVVEEHFLRDILVTSSELCAFEGFWGLHLQVFIAMPLDSIMPEFASEGLFEHTIEIL